VGRVPTAGVAKEKRVWHGDQFSGSIGSNKDSLQADIDSHSITDGRVYNAALSWHLDAAVGASGHHLHVEGATWVRSSAHLHTALRTRIGAEGTCTAIAITFITTIREGAPQAATQSWERCTVATRPLAKHVSVAEA
jgi:hypothetical protein